MYPLRFIHVCNFLHLANFLYPTCQHYISKYSFIRFVEIVVSNWYLKKNGVCENIYNMAKIFFKKVELIDRSANESWYGVSNGFTGFYSFKNFLDFPVYKGICKKKNLTNDSFDYFSRLCFSLLCSNLAVNIKMCGVL